jgi:acyl carrier protein
MATNGATPASHRAGELVAEILVGEFSVQPAQIAEDASLTDDLWLDSLALIELRQILEDRFKAIVSDERALEVQRVRDLIGLVLELSGNEPAEVAGP